MDGDDNMKYKLNNEWKELAHPLIVGGSGSANWFDTTGLVSQTISRSGSSPYSFNIPGVKFDDIKIIEFDVSKFSNSYDGGVIMIDNVNKIGIAARKETTLSYTGAISICDISKLNSFTIIKQSYMEAGNVCPIVMLTDAYYLTGYNGDFGVRLNSTDPDTNITVYMTTTNNVYAPSVGSGRIWLADDSATFSLRAPKQEQERILTKGELIS